MSEHEERAKYLHEQLREASYRYYALDQPIISDAEYDRMMAELERLEDAHPELITPTSPTQWCGWPPPDAQNTTVADSVSAIPS